MSASVAPTESATLTVLRSWLLSVLPGGTSVIRAYDNSVAMPVGDFVLMTPLSRQRMDTNREIYNWDSVGLTGDRQIVEALRATVQIDTFGSNAADNMQIVQALWRDRNATTFFTEQSFDGGPLYASDPRRLSFVNGQDQYEDRWSIDLVMQVNATITTAQDYATALDVGVINVDATYPPA